MFPFIQRFVQAVVTKTQDNSVKGNKYCFSSINDYTDAP